MVDPADSMERPPWAVRWAVGVPVAAVAALLFFARAWDVPWHWRSVAALAMAAWILGVWVQWPVFRRGRERWVVLGALVFAGVALLLWAGWRLPSGLVLAAVPVIGLAGLEAALGFGGSAGFAVLRLFLRAAVFSGGIWLPLVWWDGAALPREFLRLENAGFLALAYLVAVARASVPGMRLPWGAVRWGAMILAGAAAAGLVSAAVGRLAATCAVYLGVAAGAATLALWLEVRGRWPRQFGLAGWFPEVVFGVMVVTTMIRW